MVRKKNDEQPDPRIENAKAMLRDHVRNLRGRNLLVEGKNPLEFDLNNEIAARIEAFLNDKAATLDEAFGVAPRKGPRGSKGGKPGKHLPMVIEAVGWRALGYSWNETLDKIGDKFNFHDSQRTENDRQARESRRPPVVERHYGG